MLKLPNKFISQKFSQIQYSNLDKKEKHCYT